MVPEYLTPTNGGLLSPGQLVALSRAVLGRYGGPGVAELVLDITPDVMVGKVRRAEGPTAAVKRLGVFDVTCRAQLV